MSSSHSTPNSLSTPSQFEMSGRMGDSPYNWFVPTTHHHSFLAPTKEPKESLCVSIDCHLIIRRSPPNFYFGMTSGRLKDDFRMTSGRLQEDFSEHSESIIKQALESTQRALSKHSKCNQRAIILRHTIGA